jgi:FMN reductase
MSDPGPSHSVPNGPLRAVTLNGSPSEPSRSGAVLHFLTQALVRAGISVSRVAVRELPPDALLFGGASGQATLQPALAEVAHAHGVVIATPVYKAAYSGVLKAFLDLLPEQALAGKVVLPVVVAGTPTHALALEYALKPVLAALGVRWVTDGVFVPQGSVQVGPVPGMAADIEARLDDAARQLVSALNLLHRDAGAGRGRISQAA